MLRVLFSFSHGKNHLSLNAREISLDLSVSLPQVGDVLKVLGQGPVGRDHSTGHDSTKLVSFRVIKFLVRRTSTLTRTHYY